MTLVVGKAGPRSADSGDMAEQSSCVAKFLRGTLWNDTFAALSKLKLQAVPRGPTQLRPVPPVPPRSVRELLA